VFLDTDPVAAKMLVRHDFLAARQWADADLLPDHRRARQAAGGHRARAICQRADLADILIASMPPRAPALPDSSTRRRRWFSCSRLRGRRAWKDRRKAFLSSYGDDALLLLGCAWEQAVARAATTGRNCCHRQTSAPGDLPRLLNFPDSRIDPA
jgi:hypothetical protein